MSELTKLLNEFLVEGEEDYIGLWQVVKLIKEKLNVNDPLEIRSLTLELVRRLIETGMQAGDTPYSKNGFKLWANQHSDYVIKRIEDEWNVLGREPDIADIVWFNKT